MPVAKPAQRTLNNAFDLSGQFLTALDVMARIDLDLHVEFRVASGE